MRDKEKPHVQRIVHKIKNDEEIGLRQYYKFNHLDEFYDYYMTKKDQSGVVDHYETILGEYPQKPHFDIDIKVKNPLSQEHYKIFK